MVFLPNLGGNNGVNPAWRLNNSSNAGKGDANEGATETGNTSSNESSVTVNPGQQLTSSQWKNIGLIKIGGIKKIGGGQPTLQKSAENYMAKDRDDLINWLSHDRLPGDRGSLTEWVKCKDGKMHLKITVVEIGPDNREHWSHRIL